MCCGWFWPLSNIDLIVVIERPISASERKILAASLLKTSGRFPNPPSGPRCIELSVVLKSELAAPAYPARSEFLYGKWLRADLERGLFPEPFSDPGVTLMLAQAQGEAVPLTGPYLSELLPSFPPDQVRHAMRDAIPSLVGSLVGDERNVLLTLLARMWRTAETGAFVSKVTAADWAACRLPSQIGDTLRYAGDAYLGEVTDDWSERKAEAQRASDYLQGKADGPAVICRGCSRELLFPNSPARRPPHHRRSGHLS